MKKTLFIAAIVSLFNFQFTTLNAQQPDAVFKSIKYEWTVNPDGTSDYHYRHEVQILRNRALVAYADKGETFVVYNPDLEELTVNEVYTIQKDGTRVNMPQNAFIYQLPSECADCGRFNHIRELAMVHTGMELGCTIVVDYTVHRQYNLIYESIPLWRECPVEKLEVVVNYDHNTMDLKYVIDGNQNLPENGVTLSESGNSLHYTFENMPQTPYEPYMPDNYIPVLRIYNGTPDFLPVFDSQKFADAGDAVGQAMGGGNDKERLVKIRNFVVDNIHLNDIHPSHLGYVHSTPAEVWQTGCGTATDKAVLLAAILNDEGFQASVAGTYGDEVSVMLDTLEYRLSVRNKTPLTLYGEAKDEMVTTTVNGNFDPVLDTLEDGFYNLSLPPVIGAPDIDARRLALTRTTPLINSACDLQSNVTITLPKGLKMVARNSTQSMNFDGIGSLEISYQQKGKTLSVVRNLKLDKSLIEPAEYEKYRKLIAAWQNSKGKILLRSGK